MEGRKNISQGYVALISWIIIVFINFFQLLYVRSVNPSKFSWDDVFYYPITSITIGILLIYLFLLPVFLKIRTFRLAVQIPLFVIHGLAYTAIFIVFTFFQIALWSDNLDMNEFPKAAGSFLQTDFHNIAKNYIFLLAIYIAVEYINKREETLIQQKALENQLKEVKLQALESKLHPHFLFNALNGITALVTENPKKAEKAIVELSDLLRFVLATNLQQSIPLTEELSLLEKYASIEKMRYEDQLDIEIEMTREVRADEALIPPLILQPILENAIIHGFKGIDHPLKILVRADSHKISIRNNGAPLKGKNRQGTGLRIMSQRLVHHFGEESALVLRQEGDQVVCEITGLNL